MESKKQSIKKKYGHLGRILTREEARNVKGRTSAEPPGRCHSIDLNEDKNTELAHEERCNIDADCPAAAPGRRMFCLV
jgi:hypothetical protein